MASPINVLGRSHFVNRQNQDLRDFMVWQDWEISITKRFQS